MRIGIDFDNTIAGYDHLFFSVAREMGLVDGQIAPEKNAIRHVVRRKPEGEAAWQRLQAIVYGLRMSEALLMEGVCDFIKECRTREIPLFVVSHKTEFPADARDSVNLRDAARQWMRANGFFDAQRLGFSEHDIFFEATRTEKISRIATLGLTHFIDDLPEVFLEPLFPKDVQRFLLARGEAPISCGLRAFRRWPDIHREILAT